jgi:hypothetical protein
MLKYIVSAAIATCTFICLSGTAHAADGETCRKIRMPDNTQALMCRRDDGRWQPAEVSDDAEPTQASGLPAHAQVTYRGTWSASMTIAPRVNFNNLNLRSMLSQATNVRTRNMGGDFTISATTTGSNVHGYLWGAGFAREPFTGTIHNGTCQLTGAVGNAGDRFQGRCGPDGFSGTIHGQLRDGQSYTGTFDTSAAQVVDIDQQQRQQFAARQQEQAQADAAAAKLRNAPLAGPALTRKLEGYVQTDSRGWAFNHYDAGTVTNVKIIDGSVASGSYILRGEYTYNGGQSGWVAAKMAGPNLQCILFWDAMIGCRNLRSPEQGVIMRKAMVDALSPGSRSAPSYGNGPSAVDDGLRRQREDQEEQQRMRDSEPAPPPPAPAINSFYDTTPGVGG